MGGYALRDHLHQFIVDRFWRLSLNKVEVALFIVFVFFWQQSLVNSVSVDDDPGTGCLTENLYETNGGNSFGGDDIGQNSPRPYLRELVHIPDK